MSPLDRFLPLVAASAQRWARALQVEIPVSLVLAVMRQENPRGDPALTVREHDGQYSRGLMQVKESTALELGLHDPRLLTEPAIGIDYGVRYLAKQLRRYGGNITRAVAAYNAGSARYTSAEQFINQGYVDRVLGFLKELERPLPATGIGLGLLALGFAWWNSRKPAHAGGGRS